MDGDIIIRAEFPPVPNEVFQYAAWYEGREEGGPQGYGKHPFAALQNLLENSLLKREEVAAIEDLLQNSKEKVA